jgi:flavin-dependent dehydrogenase
MNPRNFAKSETRRKTSMRLVDGSRVAVVGGGPAGSFFSYFLLDLADKMGINIKVDIYEPRDYSLPAPQGCNMCAGVISETLIQNLATEGINIPGSVIQKTINSYILHTDLGSQRIDAETDEKRIGAVFRGAGPHDIRESRFMGFDKYMLSLASSKGANILRERVTGVDRVAGRIQVNTRKSAAEDYDLLAVATGVNTSALKLFDQIAPKYHPPEVTKTAIREYYLGQETVTRYFGDSLHVFLLDIPRLDFAILVPKGDYVSLCLLGTDIDESLLKDFLTAPEVKNCFPDGWQWDQNGCQCLPRINIYPVAHPFAHRVVFIGDCGVTRLYKDGIGAAYRAAKAAATCAVMEGVSSEEFQHHYAPFCRKMRLDNQIGRLIFFIIHRIQRFHFSREALVQMIAREQGSSEHNTYMRGVLWDTFTGSAPYQDIFFRALHPAFISRFIYSMATSFLDEYSVTFARKIWNRVH